MKGVWSNVVARIAMPSRRLTLRKLALVGTVAPLVFLALYSYLLLGPANSLASSVWGLPVVIAALGLAITAFSSLMFGAIGRLQRSVERLSAVAAGQNAQLRALSQANLAISQEMLTPKVLERVADLSRELLHARYAALSVVSEDGQIRSFHTSGIDGETRRAIGPPPFGQGVLGMVMQSVTPVRLDRIMDHRASVGFPQGHPMMTTFLGLPIRYRGRAVGSLYLTDKLGGGDFTAEDEEIAQLFANQAAVAIQNTRLYEQVQALAVETERSRISREMHDGLAQVLSYVNTKAQAVQAFLSNGDVATAQAHVTELSQAARAVYRDIREGILALRTDLGSGRSLPAVMQQYVEEFELQLGSPVTVDWRFHPDDMVLSPLQEVQVLRIVQESLTNVRKHAEATQVTLSFSARGEDLEIEIADNGRGFNPQAVERGEWPHFGLQTMQERAEAIGGNSEVDSARGKGTTVRVRVPRAVRPQASGGTP